MTIRTRYGFLSDTRAVIALRGRDELGLSAAEIARQVGVNTSGVTKAIERAEQRYGYKYHNITNRNNVPKGSSLKALESKVGSGTTFTISLPVFIPSL